MKHHGPIVLAAAAAAIFALAGCSSPTAATSEALAANDQAPLTENVTIKFGGFGATAGASAIMVGIDDGYFEDENITVELDLQQSTAAIAQLVATGDDPIGYVSYQPGIAAVAAGLDMRPIRTVQNLMPGGQRVWALKGEFEGLADLARKGGVIGVPSVGGYNELLIKAALDEIGESAKGIQFLAVAPGDMAGALERGDIQGATLPPPTGAGQFAKGDAATIEVIDDSGEYKATQGIPQGALFVNGRWADENPQVLNAFLRALDKAAEKLESTPDGAIWKSYQSKYNKLPDEVVDNMAVEHWVGDVDPDGVQRVIVLMEKYGQIAKGAVTVDQVLGR